jgi:hypothetical protein
MWQAHTLVDLEIIQLQMMLKLVSLRLETQANMKLHVYECFNIPGGRKWHKLVRQAAG